MKKGILKLSALFVSLFVGVLTTNAAIKTVGSTCDFITPPTGTDYNVSCGLKIQVTTVATSDSRVEIKPGDEIEITLTLRDGLTSFNITNNEVRFIAATDWTIDGETTKTVTLKEDGSTKITAKYNGTTTLAPEVYQIATSQYQKNDLYAEDCGFKTLVNAPGNTYICEYKTALNDQGKVIKIFYGSTGNLIGTSEDENAEAAFYKDCYLCNTPDTADDGKYHGLDGRIVDETTYKNECLKICKIEDDKYYCTDGNECDKAQYEKECTKVCKIENDKYYCKDGNECDKTKYDEECEPNPKTGSFIPYAGIAAGILLIGTSTVLVRKQTKIKKI